MWDWLRRLKPLSQKQRVVLTAVMEGWTLKSHRYLDGEKVYRLHPLNGEAVELSAHVVEGLQRRRLIHSNQKFPAATFLLTDRGQEVATELTERRRGPLSARSFLE